LFGAQSNTDEIEKAKKTLFATLDIYEKILSKQKYIAGDVHISAEFELSLELRKWVSLPL